MTTLTPEERSAIAARYDFAPGERAAVAAELRERERQIARADLLAWCHERNAQRQAAERAAAERPPARDWPQRERSAVMDWAAIDKCIRAAGKAQEKVLLAGIADVMGEENAKLRKQIAELTARLDKLEQVERSAVTPFLRTVSGGN